MEQPEIEINKPQTWGKPLSEYCDRPEEEQLIPTLEKEGKVNSHRLLG